MTIIPTTLRKIGIDGFIFALCGMILLAWAYPPAGLGYGWYSLPSIAGYGVSVVFFLYGLKIDPQKLKQGLGNWKLPLLVHLATFILFPLLVLPFRQLFTDETGRLLWLGSFFMAALPSTVSSAVVMVSIAGGNIPSAVFNASLSSILGVFITPVWMQLVVSAPGTQGARGPSFGGTILSLVLQVLVPITIGFLLNRRAARFMKRYGSRLKYLDQFTILLIVYTAFCESFHLHMFSQLGLLQLLLLGGCLVILFFTVFLLLGWLSKRLGFSREDRITTIFCGSKKSLVQGTVMAKVLFAGSGGAGLILLPIMIYHALQLIMSGIIANKWGEEKMAASYKTGSQE